MKKILLLLLIAAATGAGAQPLAVTTTTITKGYNCFSIDNVKFPLNSVLVNIRSNDTSMVEIDLVHGSISLGRNSVLIQTKKRVKYINGTTGIPFVSITALRGYCDSFLFSH